MKSKKEAAFNLEEGSFEVKIGLAATLRGGVIIDVSTPEQARIAEEGGAAAVMVLEKQPSELFSHGNVSRMSTPSLITSIQEAVSIPVMAKCRIGHFVEAQILEALFVDFIDESEVLSRADLEHHINKQSFRIPFLCSCKNLGEALRRIGEGAVMLRTEGEAGTGNIAYAVSHLRAIYRDVRRIASMDSTELMTEAKELGAPYRLVEKVANEGKLPVPLFAGGGVTTAADAALLMQLDAEGIFIGHTIFESKKPARTVKALVKAVANFHSPEKLAKISEGLLSSVTTSAKKQEDFLVDRGW